MRTQQNVIIFVYQDVIFKLHCCSRFSGSWRCFPWGKCCFCCRPKTNCLENKTLLSRFPLWVKAITPYSLSELLSGTLWEDAENKFSFFHLCLPLSLQPDHIIQVKLAGGLRMDMISGMVGSLTPSEVFSSLNIFPLLLWDKKRIFSI